MKKKSFIWFIAIIASSMIANATVYSGSCGAEGDNVVWQLNTSNGVLTISGNGEMANYNFNTYDAPWQPYKSNMTSVIINYGVTSIGTYAFQQCTSIKTVSIPNSVTILGHGAFKSCHGLTSVTIPESVERLTDGGTTFQYCSSLQFVIWNAISCVLEQHPSGSYYPPFINLSNITSFVFGENVQVIPRSLCKGLTGLTSIELPGSVTEIGPTAFENCSGLKTLFCKAVTPPTLDEDVFLSVNQSSCTLYVPAGSLELYKAAEQWKEFGSIKVITKEKKANIVYLNQDESELHSEKVTFHMPDAPEIEGFTFLRWDVVAGTFTEGIYLQSVYEYKGEPTSAPEVYTNPANPAQKLIRNGSVYILTDDSRTYTLTGQQVK